jgi:hypothetical protein
LKLLNGDFNGHSGAFIVMLICVGQLSSGFSARELTAINVDNVVDLSADIISDADAMTYGASERN